MIAFDARSRVALAFSTFVLVACSSDDDGSSGAPKVQVKDKLGRTCTIVGSSEVSCDKAPEPTGGCTGGATACYSVGTTGSAAGPGAICAGCCSGNTGTSKAGDCSNVVCSTNAECPPTYSRCVNGECRY